MTFSDGVGHTLRLLFEKLSNECSVDYGERTD